jgi:3-deoxy-D-manno-octulosonic-acid transferase
VLVAAARARGVRLGMVSATLAPGSSRARGLAPLLLRDAYAALDAVGAIADDDAARLRALGVRAERIRVTGDTRYDQVWARARAAERDAARAAPPLAPLLAPPGAHRFTLVAGSTWPADDAVLLPAWTTLAADRGAPPARLVVAPHEPTPAHLAPVAAWAERAGLTLARLSAVERGEATGDVDVLLVDRVGVLGDLYAVGQAAFVGGGFHAAGCTRCSSRPRSGSRWPSVLAMRTAATPACCSPAGAAPRPTTPARSPPRCAAGATTSRRAAARVRRRAPWSRVGSAPTRAPGRSSRRSCRASTSDAAL